jgi:hypothetical protein
MSTVGAVIDRLFRTYLEPPDYQPVIAFLQSAVSSTDGTLTFSGFVVPEDQELLRVGVLLEGPMGELMRVVDTNGTDATVIRARFSTTAEAMGAGDEIKLSPPFPRTSVFEAVRDNIITLSPKLYTVRHENLVTVDRNVAGMPDALAIEVIEIWGDDWTSDVDFDGRIVDYHPSVDGRALVTNNYQGNVWIRYRRRMGVAVAETEQLEDLGVEPTWVSIIMAGAAADLLVGRDVPASHVNWVGQVLQAENINVGTRQQIGFRLTQYRDKLLDEARKEMDVEYRPKVHMRDPLRQVVR